MGRSRGTATGDPEGSQLTSWTSVLSDVPATQESPAYDAAISRAGLSYPPGGKGVSELCRLLLPFPPAVAYQGDEPCRHEYPGPWFGHWLQGGQEKRCPAIRRVATSRAAKQIPVVSARPRRRHTAAKRDAAMLVRVHAGKCCCAQGGVDERPEQPVVRGVSSMASVDGTTPAVGERGSSTCASDEARG
jgi:hypothetical protein